ncbi:unnamed protein product [Clavelina lepadiformis]|uniref:Uncharacterized protein n=1 Tax=Clavelina lepadiformis TaxID=159417 RepID=A0ABP0GNI7_CLALP
MDNLTTTALPPSTTTLHPGVHLLLEQAVGIAAFFVILIVFACIVYFCDMCSYVSNCIRDCSCACSCGRKCCNACCRQRESVPDNTFNNPVKFSKHEVAIV